MTTTEAAAARPAYKRKVRNYLLDAGLQLRYTATIVVVAIFLTAGLGFKMYQATREISRIILFTGLADPATAQELQAQFANSDRVVLWGIIGFGFVLILSISAVGILITHKVVGPLYKISSLFTRVRDNLLGSAPPEPAQRGRAAGLLFVFPRDASVRARPRRRRRARAGRDDLGDRGHAPRGVRRRFSARWTSSASFASARKTAWSRLPKRTPEDRAPQGRATPSAGVSRGGSARR